MLIDIGRNYKCLMVFLFASLVCFFVFVSIRASAMDKYENKRFGGAYADGTNAEGHVAGILKYFQEAPAPETEEAIQPTSVEDFPKDEDGEPIQQLDIKTIVYNRIPKTGSTTALNVIHELCQKNNCDLNSLSPRRTKRIGDGFLGLNVYSIMEQMRLARILQHSSGRPRSIYHGHITHVDFDRFGLSTPPVYINMVRDPIARMLSSYYVHRYGDTHGGGDDTGDETTFDECMRKRLDSCAPETMMWKQIPFFCGTNAECLIPGSQFALLEAKRNLMSKYLLVGVTEKMDEFFAAMEAILPLYFKGAAGKFNEVIERGRLRQTIHKKPPSNATIAIVKQSRIWKMENEFYEFAKRQFDHNAHLLLKELEDGRYKVKYGEQFHVVPKTDVEYENQS